MKNMFEMIFDGLNEFLEDCKEKEYVVFYEVNMTNGRYDYYTFTKNQLLNFLKENETKKIIVFKIKDEVKIKKEFTIEEKEDD